MNTVTAFELSVESQLSDTVYGMPIKGLYFVAPHRSDDFRGFYAELELMPDIETTLNKQFVVKQVNHARSEKNVARGFHAEKWNKLITVTHGSCFCVWVDLRPESDTFGHAVSMLLGDGTADQYGSVYVSAGIGNGYVVTDGPADYIYLTDALYRDRDQKFDRAISLFDNELNIQWPVPRMEMVLSQRDKQALSLEDLRAKGFDA